MNSKIWNLFARTGKKGLLINVSFDEEESAESLSNNSSNNVSESVFESGEAGFKAFCESNWKTNPTGWRSQSSGWFDFSATSMELQSGVRDEKVAGSLDFLFWSSYS